MSGDLTDITRYYNIDCLSSEYLLSEKYFSISGLKHGLFSKGGFQLYPAAWKGHQKPAIEF